MSLKTPEQTAMSTATSPIAAQIPTRPLKLLRQYRTLIVVILLLLLPLFVPATARYEVGMWSSWAIMALSVVVVTGASGQVTLGHAGLMAVGAYSAAITTTKLDLPQPLPLIAAVLVSTIVGVLLAFACLKLNGIYLAVVTLAFGWAVPELALYFEDVTGGYQGLFPGGIKIGDFTLTDGLSGVYFGIFGVIIAYVIVTNMLSNWSRLNVLAVKQSEILASSFGVVPARQRVWAFGVSSALAGLGGYVYAYTVGAVTPSSFTFDNSVAFLAAAVIGGLVSPFGALIGAAFVSMVPNLLASRPEVASLVYGALLFIVIVLRSHASRLPWLSGGDKKEDTL